MLDLVTDFIIQIAFSIALVLFLIGVGIGALIKEDKTRKTEKEIWEIIRKKGNQNEKNLNQY